MKLPVQSTLATWPAPNEFSPVTRGSENTIVTSALLPVTLIVMILRLKIRFQTSHWKIDDSLIVASLVPTTGYAILGLMWDSQTGWKHLWDYPVGELTVGLQVALVSQILFVAAATLIKLSILIFIRRKLSESSILTKIIMIIFTVAVAAQGITFMCLTLFQCRKTSDYWSLSTQPQGCLPESQLLLASGIANVLATPLFFTLLLPFSDRKTIFTLFFGCAVVILAGVTRLHFQVSAVKSWDILWNIYPAWIAGSVELCIGTICACAPLFRSNFNCKSKIEKVSSHRNLVSNKEDFYSTVAVQYEINPERSIQTPLAPPSDVYSKPLNQLSHSYSFIELSDSSYGRLSSDFKVHCNDNFSFKISAITTTSAKSLPMVYEETPKTSLDTEKSISMFTFGAPSLAPDYSEAEFNTYNIKQITDNKEIESDPFKELVPRHNRCLIRSYSSISSSSSQLSNQVYDGIAGGL